jgi:hypothetical protein
MSLGYNRLVRIQLVHIDNACFSKTFLKVFANFDYLAVFVDHGSRKLVEKFFFRHGLVRSLVLSQSFYFASNFCFRLAVVHLVNQVNWF